MIDAIRDDLSLSSGQAGVLTSIPVLCFALATPLALVVIRRAGPDAAVVVTVLGVALGTILRSAGDVVAVVAGTVVIGVFITIGNVVVPVVIRRDVSPERVDLTTGVYTAALNIGSTITSLGTAPLALAIGWRGALLVWLVLNALALLGWLLAVGPARALKPAPRRTADRGPAALLRASGAAPPSWPWPCASRARRSRTTESPRGCPRSSSTATASRSRRPAPARRSSSSPRSSERSASPCS
ncbi:MFS transporter [Rathayibacter oskolensis]|nr:MFS transporter [Rathayibacter oskolensis]WKK71196.1 MFS transporter [Rathayibacter oskolensis]